MEEYLRNCQIRNPEGQVESLHEFLKLFSICGKIIGFFKIILVEKTKIHV